MTRVPFSLAADFRTGRSKHLFRAPRHLGWVLVALGAVTLLACDPETPGTFRLVGYIEASVFTDSSHPLKPQIPETATAAVPLEITFWTVACCLVDGGTEVTVDDRTAVVTPFDVPRSGVSTLVLKPVEHKATVVFKDPGIARIILRYRTSDDWDPYRPADGVKVYTVEVSR